MPKNDTILIDGIVEQRIQEKLPSKDIGEVFEFLALEQILKNFDLSKDEIEAGWIDGRDDGGLDGFYIFVNGILIQEVTNFMWPRSNAQLEVYLTTCKHHDTFKEAPINSVIASIQEIFDLSLDAEQLKGCYSTDLLEARSLFAACYRKLSILNPTVSFKIFYVSRGNTEEVGESVKARAKQVETIFSDFFSSSGSSFCFMGSSELVAQYRKTKSFSLNLPFVDHLSGGGDSYIVLTQLDKYYQFVTDDNQLRRYLFDSNVRDYLGDTRVNEDIAQSLMDEAVPDFWWFNNGITILATRAAINGRSVHLQDIQIVNGLQTTETIYRHFRDGKTVSASRTLAVKIVVSSDEKVRDSIIHATNNQSVVSLSSLHATDKIQRDIEQVLEKNNWYYERRLNYYRNVGKPPARFVTPLYIASGFVALLLKNPATAAVLKTRFMRNEVSYSQVFSDKVPISVWPKIVEVMKIIESGFTEIPQEPFNPGERFLAKWRGLVSLMCVARVTGKFTYSPLEFSNFDTSTILMDYIQEAWGLIRNERRSYRGYPQPNVDLVTKICREYAKLHGIIDDEAVCRRSLSYSGPTKNKIPSPEFVKSVDALLPKQPWQKDIQQEIATKLECKRKKVNLAISALVEQGRRFKQVEGVLYDLNGRIVDPSTVMAPAKMVDVIIDDGVESFKFVE